MNTRFNGESPGDGLLEELASVAEDETMSSFRAHGVIELRAFLATVEGKQFVFDVWHRALAVAIERAVEDVVREVVLPAMKATLREPDARRMLLDLVRGKVVEATAEVMLSLPKRLERMAKRMAKKAARSPTS